MITFACVLKLPNQHSKTSYSHVWVDRLYRGIKRHYHRDFDFVCLSDCENMPEYRVIPFETDSQGYWNKMELFRPGIFDGAVLYLDLDVVICRDITHDLSSLPQDRFLLVQEPYRSIHNSSLMFWHSDHSDLYRHYIANQKKVIAEYDHNLSRAGCLGDQAYIGENIAHGVIDDYVSAGFIGWVHHKISVPLIDPAILVFTGLQKPSNNLEIDMISKNWI